MTDKSETSAEPSEEEWRDFDQSCRAAFNKMFALARRLHPKGEAPEVADEYGRGLGKIAVEHGLTVDEAIRYGKDIWLRTREEFHA